MPDKHAKRLRASAQRERRAALAAMAAVLALFCLFNLYALRGSSAPPSAAFLRSDEEPADLDARISRDIDELARLVGAKADAADGADRAQFSDRIVAALLSEIEAKADADTQAESVHVVFSASCAQPNRLLQQSVLQLSAAAAGQRGPITQILSACSDEEKARVLQEPVLYHDFRRHFTPNYAINPEPGYADNYVAYNKPFGLRHWLLNAEPPVAHAVVALIDADFFFLRPLEANTGRDVSRYYAGSRDPASVNDTVAEGLALAQDWTNIIKGGIFAPDRAEQRAAVCAGKSCDRVDRERAVEAFANAGPPYLVALGDLKRMADDYCHLCVTTREVVKEWMTEMFAYSLAAANNGVQHTLLSNLGVTSAGYAGGGHEHWDFVHDSLANPCEDDLDVVLPDDAPASLHYCQFLGDFYKGQLPSSATACESPIMQLFPPSAWTEAVATPDDGLRRYHRHTVWARCSLMKVVNRALIRIKEQTCPNGFNTVRSLGLVRD